jgi:hypothetical protein
MMTRRALISSVVVLSTLASRAKAQTFCFDAVNHEVQVVMKDVDDVGFVLVLNGQRAVVAAKCEWRPTLGGGEAGQASVNLRSYLARGENLIVIGLFNRRWEGPGGKWAYDFRVNLGRPGSRLTEYWSAKDGAPDGNGEHVRKIVFCKTIHAFVDKDGDVVLSQSIKPQVRDSVKLAASEFEKALLRNGDDVAKALPQWVEAVGVVVAQLALSSTGS